MKSLLLVMVFALAGVAGMANNDAWMNDKLVGSWAYSVETPDGVYEGKLIFEKSDEGYTGKLQSYSGTASMKNLKVEGDNVSFSAEAEGFYVTIKGKIDGDSFTGEVTVEDQYFTMKAKKEK